jgi:fructose-1,6-bisphosphatase/inositol monophosphatase family enzyme
VAEGTIDAMVCYRASFLDVCAGMFLVHSAGGAILDLVGHLMRKE